MKTRERTPTNGVRHRARFARLGPILLAGALATALATGIGAHPPDAQAAGTVTLSHDTLGTIFTDAGEPLTTASIVQTPTELVTGLIPDIGTVIDMVATRATGTATIEVPLTATEDLLWKSPTDGDITIAPVSARFRLTPLFGTDLGVDAFSRAVEWHGTSTQDGSATDVVVSFVDIAATPGAAATWIFGGGRFEPAGMRAYALSTRRGDPELVHEPLGNVTDDEPVTVLPPVPAGGLVESVASPSQPHPARLVESNPSDEQVIDVLGVAATNLTNEQALASLTQGIAETNATLQNTNSSGAQLAGYRLRLVGLLDSSLAPDPTSLYNDFIKMASDETVRATRDASGADLMMMVREGGFSGDCGRGAGAHVEGASYWAGGVVAVEGSENCPGSHVRFTHEIGHILGAGHSDAGGGWASDSRSYHTLPGMPLSRTAVDDGTAARRMNYSNPERLFAGTTILTGSTDQHNGRAIAHWIDTVAAYRTTPVAATADGTITAIEPDRIVDSRINQGTAEGAWHGGESRAVSALLADAVPDDASAIVANVTVTGAADGGHIRAWGWDSKLPGFGFPDSSNVNWMPGQTRASTTIIELGDGGQFGIYSSTDAHVIIDVFGYVGGTGGALIEPVTPAARIEPFMLDATWNDVQIAGVHGVPSDAVGVVANLTVADPTHPGHIRANATKSVDTSILNFSPGQAISNFAIIALDDNGALPVSASHGTVKMFIDIQGYVGADATLQLTPIPPTRILNKSSGSGVIDVDADVTARPSDSVAALVNSTVYLGDRFGFVRVWPAGEPEPETSNVNFSPGIANSNHGIVGLGDHNTLSYRLSHGTALRYIDIMGFLHPA